MVEEERPEDAPDEPEDAPEEASPSPADSDDAGSEKPTESEGSDEPEPETKEGGEAAEKAPQKKPPASEEKRAPEKKEAAEAKEEPPEEEEEKPPMSANEDTESFAGNADAAAEQVEDIRPDIPAFRVPRENLVDAMTYLQQQLAYDHLACITALDWKDGNLEVVYNLWSYAKNRPIAVRVSLSADDPVVPSLTSLWKGADWLEREEYDLMGIRFDGHPDLRRIMLPEGWKGHPLRKDYDLKQEQYVGMDDKGDDVVYAEPREDAW